MTVMFDIPADIEELLTGQVDDLSREAKEAVLVGFYRRGLLTHAELARSLEISRLQTDAVLKFHAVSEDLLTVEEFRAQVDAARRGLGE